MSKRRFKTYIDQGSGIRFVFKHDPSEPSLLHIFVRHATSPEEAVATFFEGETRWNDEHRRYETVTETHKLYWFWLEEHRVVMVASCFRREGMTWVSE